MPDPQDPFAEFAGLSDKTPTETPPPQAPPPSGGDGGYTQNDPFAEFAGMSSGSLAAPTPDMTPKVQAPQAEDQTILGLPKEMFGMKTTDIPLAGFFLNQRTYQAPTQEQAQAQYKPEQPQTYNPLQPLGINAPISSDTPVIGGLAQAIGEAQKPTTPDYFSAGIRDTPVLGELSRVGEAALGLLGQSYKTVAEPLAGLSSIPLRGLSKAGGGIDAIGAETQKAADEALARVNAAGGIERPTDMAQEIGAIQEFGRAALAGTPAAFKFAAPIVFDPLTYAGGGLSEAQGSKIAARTGMDVADIAKMSPLERISKTGMLTSPVSKSAVEAAGEMGVLSKEALGMKPNSLLQEVVPWFYTDRSKAFELFENSVSGLLSKSQFTDAAKTRDLLRAFAESAKSNSFKPIQDAFPDLVKSSRSLEGQRIIRSLGQLDTARADAVLNDIPNTIAETMKAVTDGALGEKPSQFTKDFFDSLMSGAPKDKRAAEILRTRLQEGQSMEDLVTQAANDYAKYKMLADASDTMGKAAQGAYNLTTDERLAVKIRDAVKSLEANLFIGFSPTTVINNYVNNTVTQALHGLNPFGISKYADRMWKAWGMEPGGAFRKIQSAALGQMARDTRSAGFAGLVKGRQFGPFLKMYSKMEEGARMNIWAKGAEDYFKRAMKMSADSMPDNVAMALRAADPSGALLDVVKGAIRSSFTPDEVMGLIRGKIPVTLEAHAAEIARSMGISEDAFTAVMHQSEVWPSINDALKSSKNSAEFEKKATAILDELKSRIERARQLQGETTGSVVPKAVKSEIDSAIKDIPPIVSPGVSAPISGIIKTVEDLKSQAIPFEDFKLSTFHAHTWTAINHWGEKYVPHAAVDKWVKSGNQTEKMMESVNKAREAGKVWPDALTEFYQLRGNAAFQLLSDPSTLPARRAYYENNLREADSLMRTLNNGKKGLDYEQLAKGPTNPELAQGGKLGSEGRYVAEYSKRSTGNLPQVPTRGTGPGATIPIEPGGTVSPVSLAKVQNAPGAGGAVSPGGAIAGAGRADPAIKSAIANQPDSALQYWASLEGATAEPYATASKELLAERSSGAAGGIVKPVSIAPSTTPGAIEPIQGGIPTGVIEPTPRVAIPESLKNAIQDLRDVAGESASATGMQADELVAARYQPVADAIEALYPNLQKFYDSASRMEQATPEVAAARTALEQWVQGGLTGAMTDARTAAARIGDWYVQRNILNYSARTNFDDWLSWIFPFSYWPRATATNYAMEALNRPALITNYVRSKEALDKIQQDEGFPARFRGAIPVPMPFASMTPWLSGKLFFDPLKDWLPIDRFTTEPAKALSYLQPNSTDIANEIRSKMQSGEITSQDGEAALKQQKGNKVWDSVETAMRQQQQPDPLDVSSLIFSPHFPLDWANKVMQGRPQDISYLIPLSRQIKGGSAILQAAFPQLKIPSALGGPEGPQGGLDLEGALRTKLGLPPADSTAEYRIDRMLASMSVDGSVPTDKARLAMIERKGPIYEEAVRRAAIETGVGSISGLLMFNSRVMAGGEQIAMNDAKQVSELVDNLVKGAGGDPIRMSYDEKKKLLQDNKGADGKPLWGQVSNWYSTHPEYKPRLELFDTAEGRLSNWLSDEIWNKYNALSALDRRLFSDQNPDFKTQFAAKPTRQRPENIPNSLLEKWAKAIGGYVPSTPDKAPTSMPTLDQIVAALQKSQAGPEQYRPQDPAMAKKYDEWLARYTAVSKLPAFQEYQQRLNAIESVQTQYYALPAGQERKTFAAQHPELTQYWEWSRQLKQNDPTLKDYFAWDAQFWKDNPELAKILGRSPTTSSSSGYIPVARGGGGGGGYSPRSFTPTARKTGGTSTGTSSTSVWNAMVNELGGPNSPLVSKIEAWLTMEPGNGNLYASKNSDLANWLAGKSQAYLDSLRASYQYRLHHPPATIQGKKQYNIRYLKPTK